MAAALVDVADGPSLRRGFLRQAERTPDALALVVRGKTLTYAELSAKAKGWAAALLERLPHRPERIGIFAYRSEVSYVGTMAALMAGAAFVPLNPTFPPAKTAAMIEAADLDALIVDTTAAKQFETAIADKVGLVLAPEHDTAFSGMKGAILLSQDLRLHRRLKRFEPLALENTAYLLFTSGSTGEPKGVPVTHGNVLHFLDVMSRRYGIGANDRLSQTFDQTFDLSIFDLFMAWTNGACVYSMATIDLLAPTKFINQNGITVWFSVPSVIAQVLTRKTLLPGSMPNLRLSLFCGEALPSRSAMAWQSAAPNSIVENLYGPTELTIACFVYRWDSATSLASCRNDLVPIGRPLEGLGAVVVDDQLHSVDEGAIGELCVCGPQTAPGYWKDPAKTAERYVSLPTNRREMRRFYRTGDRVSRLPDGDYVFLGRGDNQVKILGHRVELAEIEATLRRNDDVEHAVAIPWPIVEGSAQGVVAFISGHNVKAHSLLQQAKKVLPAYMVPKEIVLVQRMLLNANGKVDRGALRELLVKRGESAPLAGS
jgi:amino acid adenylation domain-containing protein